MAKDWSTLNAGAQSEALINEVKGNLFEYLVAFELARYWKVSGEFVRHFSGLSAGKAQSEMRHYQEWLRENDPELFTRLPLLAHEAAERFLANYQDLSITEVLLTGKSGAVSGQNHLMECDILLKEKERIIPISLKFCKHGAFVNTKSGGIRSFVQKYFDVFSEASIAQENLNNYLEQSFNQMALELYEWADIEGAHLMEKKGHFSPEWVQRGLPELPGELPEAPRSCLFAHYYRVIGKLYETLKSFHEQDASLFQKCLAPLMGFSDTDMIQLTLFHKSTGKRYELAGVEIEDWQGEKELVFHPLKEGISSFSFGLGKKHLQIRLKPMNKFTVSALKVNCSVKTGGSH